MARHLLDHASTTPLRPEAVEASLIWNTLAAAGELGDPSRIHTEGLRARVALEDARAQVASFVGARSREVVFTSGTTESVTSATWGAVRRAVERGSSPHVVLSAVEHSSVRTSSTRFAEAFGGAVTTVGVDPTGRVSLDELLPAITPATSLVHVQWGNHEVGTLQPLAQIIERCRSLEVLVHVDASNAVGHVPVDFAALGADLLSFSGHRFGAPTGTGVLLIRRGLRLEPLLVGSDQERGRRAGLESLVPLLALGSVAEALDADRLATEMQRVADLTSRIIAFATAIDGTALLGDPDPHGRLPQLACIGIDGVEPQAVLLVLDRHGIAAHSGSACASEDIEPSPVLEAMGADAARSLRLSVGWNSTDDDVGALEAHLGPVIADLRALTR